MSDNAQNAVNNQTNENNAPSFDVLRIYIKDCSFETPNVPKIFTVEWKPEMSVDFDTKLAQVDSDKFEVDIPENVTEILFETTGSNTRVIIFNIVAE